MFLANCFWLAGIFFAVHGAERTTTVLLAIPLPLACARAVWGAFGLTTALSQGHHSPGCSILASDTAVAAGFVSQEAHPSQFGCHICYDDDGRGRGHNFGTPPSDARLLSDSTDNFVFLQIQKNKHVGSRTRARRHNPTDGVFLGGVRNGNHC